MSPNLENSAVAVGLEKVSSNPQIPILKKGNSNPKEGQGQRMFKLPHNCTHVTC